MFRAADVGKAAAAILHVLSCQPFGTLNTMAIILAHLSYLPDTEVQGISFDDLKRVIDEGGEVVLDIEHLNELTATTEEENTAVEVEVQGTGHENTTLYQVICVVRRVAVADTMLGAEVAALSDEMNTEETHIVLVAQGGLEIVYTAGKIKCNVKSEPNPLFLHLS